MEMNFIKNDTRVFTIRPNAANKSRFKIMKSAYQRDSSGHAISKVQGSPSEGYRTVEHEIDGIVLMPGAAHTFCPPRRPDNGKILTGLDEVISNPYKNEEYFPNEKFEKALKGREMVKLQHVLEYEHGVEFDYYTSDIPQGLPPKTGKRFFETPEQFLKLGNSLVYLRMDTPRDRVLYYCLTARHPSIIPMVAKNLQELRDNPDAKTCKWYFVDEEEKQNIKMSSIQSRNKLIAAIEAIAESKKSDDIIKMIKAIGIDEAKELDMTPEKAYIVLNEFVMRNSDTAKVFMEHYDLWKDKVHRNLIDAYAEIFDFVQEEIIRTKYGKYEVILKDPKGGSEIKLYNTKNALAKEFILDPVFKEYVEDFRSTLKAIRTQ